MRRFLTFFNALLLGVILGMISLAVVRVVPTPDHQADRLGERTLTISLSLARCAHEQRCALRK
jgi:hypothetical protein